jgi:hypothetical protein
MRLRQIPNDYTSFHHEEVGRWFVMDNDDHIELAGPFDTMESAVQAMVRL